MRLKQFILFLFHLLIIWQLQGQTPCSINALNGTLPSKCLEIESVLVNACTNSEGYDEMARIKIGPNPILLSNLTTVKWATSNPWQGWATWDATNLAKLVTINNLIQSAGNCGKVIKVNPTDIIPAYSNLLIITSTLFDEYAQDFSGLIDTMYVAIQNNQTVLTGHFSNQTNNTKQTFILGTSSCSDTVSFYGNQMIKANGTFGSEDGSSVEFTFNGTAKYFNNGCKIPQQTLKVDAGTVNSQYCQGYTVKLFGTNSGAKCSWWYPENRSSGVFLDSTLNATQFVINKTYFGNIKLYFKIIGNCGKYLIDSVEFSINSGTVNLNRFTPLSQGTYQIGHVVFNGGCYDTSFHQIIASDRPDSKFSLTDSVLCLDEDPLLLTPNHLGGVFSGQNIVGNKFYPTNSGIYSLTYILDNQGCIDSTIQTIRVSPLPSPSINITPETTWVNTPILITYTGSPVISYLWHTGDGNTVVDSNSFSHIYTKDNFYDIELEVMNNDGCKADITKRVMILAEEHIYVPNVFTPNYDGLNETFHISHSNVHQFTMYIYNRWGEKIFTSNNPDIEWDGSFQGVKCSEGVYFYVIVYRTLQGHLRDMKGTVTLLR